MPEAKSSNLFLTTIYWCCVIGALFNFLIINIFAVIMVILLVAAGIDLKEMLAQRATDMSRVTVIMDGLKKWVNKAQKALGDGMCVICQVEFKQEDEIV